MVAGLPWLIGGSCRARITRNASAEHATIRTPTVGAMLRARQRAAEPDSRPADRIGIIARAASPGDARLTATTNNATPANSVAARQSNVESARRVARKIAVGAATMALRWSGSESARR